jgi:hypothetical protein
MLCCFADWKQKRVNVLMMVRFMLRWRWMSWMVEPYGFWHDGLEKDIPEVTGTEASGCRSIMVIDFGRDF